MSKIAIDVVLIPSDEVIELSISLNKELLKNFKSEYILNKNTFVPHISLCMICTDEKNLPLINKELKAISKKINKIELEVLEVSSHKDLRNLDSNSIQVKNTTQLQSIHEEICELMKKYHTDEVNEEYFFEPKKVLYPTVDWVKGYLKKDRKKFDPHISLGFGKLNNKIKKINFKPKTLSVYQLGDYCTCRKKLIEIPI